METLKATLQNIDFKNIEEVKSMNLSLLIEQMLETIGTLDSELRDHLIYTTFYKLIAGDFLNSQQLEHILLTCLDKNHLFFNIGEAESDSVFTRSFSSLVIALVLEKDKQKLFLSKGQVEQSIEKSIYYLQQEKDTRGYVNEKGWAHSIAHGSDLIAVCVEHPSFNKELVPAILETIAVCICKERVYIDDEDERLLFIIEALIEKEVEEDVLKDWILSLSNHLERIYEEEEHLVYYRKRTNVLNFLKTLYFRLAFKNTHVDTRNLIMAVLKDWHNRLYGRVGD
ncbi:MAG: DUF2785 domain-containing protein [Bacillaceae bacterium]